MKIAVITPYYKEKLDVLKKSHLSVMNQTVPCHHIVIADGHPKSYFDTNPRVSHIRLPAANGDVGNTPRLIGAIFAESQGYDAVAFLDADNWFASNHLENMLVAQKSSGAPLVSCRRTLVDGNGAILPVIDHEDFTRAHVDTSCWLVMREAFMALQYWWMPKQLGPIGDRVFFKNILFNKIPICYSDFQSVFFRTQYAAHYRAAGREPPEDSKTLSELNKEDLYLKSPQGAQEFRRLFGFDYFDVSS